MEGKRPRAAETSSQKKKAKRQVSRNTFDKWKRVYEKEYQAVTWLRCSMDSTDNSVVSTLWCAVCKQYESGVDRWFH